MFLVEQALHQILFNDVGVFTIVKSSIYPTVLLQTTVYPALVYRQVAGEHIISLLGSSGLKRSRFRIFSTATAPTGGYAQAKQLDETVRLALQGFAGILFNPLDASETLRIEDIQVQSTHDLFDDPTQTFQVVTDFDIWSDEPIP